MPSFYTSVMASSIYNIDNIVSGGMPTADDMRIGIVVSEWNDNITMDLLAGAVETLQQYGVRQENILIKTVPGSFELIFGCAQMAKSGLVDGIIAIGCVIRGDTPHFEYISSGVTNGLSELNCTNDVPIIFGVLTTNNLQQAEERAGGILGNKGNEYAATVIKMVDLRRSLRKKQ